MSTPSSQPADYDHFTHRHNFAAWAAARAAQRGFTNVSNLKASLESSGLVEFLHNTDSLDTDSQTFDRLHRLWCSGIIRHLTELNVDHSTYGRAAKLVAVYLKAMIVIGPASDSLLAKVAHPPIDRVLLTNMARSPEINSQHKKDWARINWTDLNESNYFTLIDQLRNCLDHQQPIWYLEKYWAVTTS